jgi:hypothetical protein
MATREPVVLLHKESPHVGLLISGAEAERDSRVEAKAETCLDKARPERSARSRCVASGPTAPCSKSNTRILMNGTVKRGFGHVEGVYAPSEVVGSWRSPVPTARACVRETRGARREVASAASFLCVRNHTDTDTFTFTPHTIADGGHHAACAQGWLRHGRGSRAWCARCGGSARRDV